MRNLVYVVICFFILLSCKKYKNHPIPSVPFDIELDMSLPSYSELLSVSGYAFATANNRNIIVYRRSYEEFLAFDRESPAEGGLGCDTPLTPSEQNFLELIDKCSGAKFLLIDGSAIEGSKFGLRQYRTVWFGNNKLRVYN